MASGFRSLTCAPQKRHQNRSAKLPRGAQRTVIRVDSESTDKSGDRGCPKTRQHEHAHSSSCSKL
eukprot:1129573-Alexandrium_andersonii.AAC.1